MARLLVVLALLHGCGRIGVELAPADGSGVGVGGGDDGGTPDATVELPRVCAGADCFAAGCPSDPDKTAPGVCGCGRSDRQDSDGDGVADCVDFCPGLTDRLESGACGCAAASADSDGDGVENCNELCAFDPAKQAPGLCGCGVSEGGDSDGDGSPDCDDACPNDPTKQEAGACGCGVDERDQDLDMIPDCVDRCTVANQASYARDASCGLGYCRANNTPSRCVDGQETACMPAAAPSASDLTCDGVDDDCNGQVDDGFVARRLTCGVGTCSRVIDATACTSGVETACTPGTAAASDTTCDNLDDDCDGRTDEGYVQTTVPCGTGACAMTGQRICVMGVEDSTCVTGMPAASDASCNNRDDDCDGFVDEDYVETVTTCGTGPCARTGMRECQSGRVVDTCVAGTASASTDASCNGVDDDCDGRVDDDFVVSSTSCGVGACARTGSATCASGMRTDSCRAGTPRSGPDDSQVPGDGIDNDCDGRVDEDLPACTATTRTFEAGAHASLSLPGNCHNLTVQLWGGAGASGEPAGLAGSGNGGAGGYATITARLTATTGAITVYVGTGGATNCENPGTNAGSNTFNGGNGGGDPGSPGADGVVAGGGEGGNSSPGYPGGRGHFGGGGGGEGSGGLGNSGGGGGGGAASVLLVNNARVAVAGGGGGGGGAKANTILGTISSRGGDGGSGCGQAGQVSTGPGGGGGGGGMCQGATVQAGSGVTPAMSGSIPSGRARGGDGTCVAGGAGYAIVRFDP
ncbi:MAG: MopE-related protein [Polyangiales bacterium]